MRTQQPKPQADLKALIAAQQDRYDITGDEIAAALGIGRSSWYRLRNNLDDITLEQLKALKKFLRISRDELLTTIKI